MVSTNLEQYSIADFLKWFDEGRLVLNPEFQRKGVWSPAARTFLIDTILNRMPIPKIFLRSSINLETKQSVREVVDGQQRLRTIIDFANNKFVLTNRSKHYRGFRYESLTDEDKEKFLFYMLSVDQLIGASDDDVLEVFARLNSYSVKLNAPERRHAEYQGDFRWTVIDITKEWKLLWDNFRIVSISQRLRMMDYSLIAECLAILLEGIRDGGQEKITKCYSRYDKEIPNKDEIVHQMNETLQFLTGALANSIAGAIARPPHFLMLFAAAAHSLYGIPQGDLRAGEWPDRLPARADINEIGNNLAILASAIDEDEVPDRLKLFAQASRASTQRISSRRIRFPFFVDALTQPAV